MTITLDPPVEEAAPLAAELLLETERQLRLDGVWSSAAGRPAPAPLRRRHSMPGRVGGVRSLPAVLDPTTPSTSVAAHAAPQPSAATTVERGGRVWSVDATDGPRAPAAPLRLAPLLGSPEFERRRRAVEAELRRRARQPFVWVALVGTIVLLGALALVSPWLSVRTVDVVGVDAATADLVRSAAGPLQGRAMVRVDPTDVVRRLEARADIAAVRVSKDWPSRVVIEPVLRTPIAIVRAAGRPDRVIDGTGAVLSPGAGAGLTLPVIAEEASDTLTERAEDRAARLVEATAVLRSLGPDLRARLSRLDHFGDEFVARFGRASVQLGRATDLAAKAAAIRSLADAGQLATATNVDVSVPDTAIVTTSSARRS